MTFIIPRITTHLRKNREGKSLDNFPVFFPFLINCVQIIQEFFLTNVVFGIFALAIFHGFVTLHLTKV